MLYTFVEFLLKNYLNEIVWTNEKAKLFEPMKKFAITKVTNTRHCDQR